MKPCWLFETQEPIRVFLPAAARIIKGDLTVCFEHAHTPPRVIQFYSQHRSRYRYKPERDTISPRTRLFYCRLTPEFTDRVLEMAQVFAIKDMLWHMRGYDEKRLIFYSHDACDGADVVASPLLPEALIRHLGREAHCDVERTKTLINWEEIIRIGNSEPDGAANGSQPIRSERNRTLSAAGSRR